MIQDLIKYRDKPVTFQNNFNHSRWCHVCGRWGVRRSIHYYQGTDGGPPYYAHESCAAYINHMIKQRSTNADSDK